MSEREQKEQQLRDEVIRCLIISKEDRKFWIDHASTLPNIVLENITKIVKEKNRIMDEYLMEALENDPDHLYLTNLKAKILEIKKKAFELDQTQTTVSAEEFLKKQLEDL